MFLSICFNLLSFQYLPWGTRSNSLAKSGRLLAGETSMRSEVSESAERE